MCDVVADSETITVASPAAGGVVRIDRASGAASLVPLDTAIGRIVMDDGVLWAIAHHEWEQWAGGVDDVAARPRRRVVVQEPTDAEMAAWREQVAGWSGVRPGVDGGPPVVVPLAEAPAVRREALLAMAARPITPIPPATPVWRIEAGDAQPVDLGGIVMTLTATRGYVVAVCCLPTDPAVHRIEPGGYVACISPATVIVGNIDAGFVAIGSVEDSKGSFCVDGDDVWLIDGQAQRVDVAARQINAPVPMALTQPVAVVNGMVVDRGWDGATPLDIDADRADRLGTPVVRILSIDTGDAKAVVPVPTSSWMPDGSPLHVEAHTVWFADSFEPRLFGVDTDTGKLHDAFVEFDCAPFLPPVTPPPGANLEAHERAFLDRLRDEIFGGWTTPQGEQRPFIDGVTFEVVERRGTFPDTEIVALFHADERPDTTFGRAWPCYDELGNPAARTATKQSTSSNTSSQPVCHPTRSNQTQKASPGSEHPRWLVSGEAAVCPRRSCFGDARH